MKDAIDNPKDGCKSLFKHGTGWANIRNTQKCLVVSTVVQWATLCATPALCMAAGASPG